MLRVDLNCDLGESFGRYTLGLDSEIIPLISSCNVACGMHAGDPTVMRQTVQLACDAEIAIGAHPGYPDLQGFGRRDMNLSPDEAYACVVYQIGALDAFCKTKNKTLNHVKPHGQMYNRAAVDRVFADAIAAAVADFNNSLVLVGLANSALIEAGRAVGLQVAEEFFVDRNYTPEGKLVARSDPRALITDEEFAVARLVQAIKTGCIESVDGSPVHINADTVCVHGDNAHALAFVRRIRETLEEEGIRICPVG